MKTLRDIRIERKLTLTEAASAMGITNAALSRIERGLSKPNSHTLSILARFYDLPVEDIRALAYESRRDEELAPHPLGPTVQIPIIGSTAAGYGELAASSWTGDFATLPAEYLHGADSRDHFALYVKGHSMEPRIMDGDVAILRKQPDVSNGDIGLVIYGDDIDAIGTYGTLKKVLKNDDGSLTLVALNPDFEPLTISGEDLQSVRIQGRLEHIVRSF